MPGLNASLTVVGAIGASDVLWTGGGGDGGGGGRAVVDFLVLKTRGGNGVGLLRLREML